MKKILLSALIITVMFLRGFSQTRENKGKEVNAPNFLVHNQLSPESLKIEYTGGISSGTLEKNGHEINQFKQSTFTLSGYPLTVVDKKYQQVYVGFGYTQDKYTPANTETGSQFSEQTFHAINVNVFMNTRIRENVYWSSYFQAGVQGSSPFENVSTSHNEISINKINYKAKRNMNVGVGMVYVSNLGKPLILPAVAFAYSGKYYLVNIDFPVKAEVEGIFKDGQWRPVVGVSFPGSTYRMKNANEYFSTSGLTGYLGMRYRLLDFLYVYGAWQTGLGETFKYGERRDRKEIGTFNGQNRFVVSINVQVARMIPEGRR